MQRIKLTRLFHCVLENEARRIESERLLSTENEIPSAYSRKDERFRYNNYVYLCHSLV
jgi:hypothetical protein